MKIKDFKRTNELKSQNIGDNEKVIRFKKKSTNAIKGNIYIYISENSGLPYKSNLTFLSCPHQCLDFF